MQAFIFSDEEIPVSFALSTFININRKNETISLCHFSCKSKKALDKCPQSHLCVGHRARKPFVPWDEAVTHVSCRPCPGWGDGREALSEVI